MTSSTSGGGMGVRRWGLEAKPELTNALRTCIDSKKALPCLTTARYES